MVPHIKEISLLGGIFLQYFPLIISRHRRADFKKHQWLGHGMGGQMPPTFCQNDARDFFKIGEKITWG